MADGANPKNMPLGPVERGASAPLTTRQGHPVYDNQNTRSVGERGPLVLEDYQFLEKISHFDRERIPERVVHARGAGAHGVFTAYGKVGRPGRGLRLEPAAGGGRLGFAPWAARLGP